MSFKSLNSISQLHVELAARCPMDDRPVEVLSPKKVVLMTYRFDTRHIWGDFTEVTIVAAVASEQSARAALLEIIASQA